MAARWMMKNPKRVTAEILKWSYAVWKAEALKQKKGFFPIFNGFKQTHLKEISGNALKLYVYLGLHGKNATGESFHSVETIARFFDASPRAIKVWIKELVDRGLIERVQLKKNASAFTYLKGYEFLPLQPEEAEDPDNDTPEGAEELLVLLDKAKEADNPALVLGIEESLKGLGVDVGSKSPAVTIPELVEEESDAR